MAAFALGAPAAHAAGIVVRSPAGETRIDETTLRNAADVPAGTHTLRDRPETGDAIAHPPAVSLPRLLELAGVAPTAVSFVSVRRPNGTLAVLRAADLARPAPFPEGPPLVWLDADSVRFLRPVRDDADVNGADNIATAGEDLFVRVHQGPLLAVTVRVDPQRRRARERVQLEARVTGAPAGTALAVTWRFGDGGEAIGTAVSHRWRRAGVYAVVATAEGADDSGGASEPVIVRVGPARKRAGPAGGGRDDAEEAPATGPAETPDPAAGAQPVPAPTLAPQAEATAPEASAPQGAAPGEPQRAAPQEPPRERRKRRRRAERDEALPGVPVRGILVAARLPAGTPAGVAVPLAAARRGGAPTTRAAARTLAGVAACSLLAAGAWRERRRRRQ